MERPILSRMNTEIPATELEKILGLLSKGDWKTASEIKAEALGDSSMTQSKLTRALVDYRERGTIQSRNRSHGLVEWAFTPLALERWNAGLRGRALTTASYTKGMVVRTMEETQ